MPFSDYSSPCESTSDGLPKEQQTSREWVLEWNRKSDTSEVQEYLQQLQRSHSHSHPENADSPESFSRSSSVPRYTGFDGQADVEMEGEPFEIQKLGCSPGKKFVDVHQTVGEVTSDNCIADDQRGNERSFVSCHCWDLFKYISSEIGSTALYVCTFIVLHMKRKRKNENVNTIFWPESL